MKFEVGKSYKTRGGWRADVISENDDQGYIDVKHNLNNDRTMNWRHHSIGGVAFDVDDEERPYPEGWDHPSDLTQEKWKE